MSVRLPFGGSRRDDDELLDRLGRGEHVDDGDVERMLSNWRASMPTAGPADDRLLDAVVAAVARPRRGRRHIKVTASVAAAALLVGLTVAATQAGPDSPLWPVTQLVLGGDAESRAAAEDADDALEDARTAVDQGRIPDAIRLLAQADQLVDKVGEPGAADRLRDDIAMLRAQLRGGAAATSAVPSTPPASTGGAPSSNPPDRPAAATPTEPPAQTPDAGESPTTEPGPTLPVDPPEPPTKQPPRSGKPVRPPGYGGVTGNRTGDSTGDIAAVDITRMPTR